MNLGTGTDRTYNFASIGFLIAALLTCIITLLILLFGGGGNGSGLSSQALPTTVNLPTATITPVPTITNTPLPATFTPTFTATTTGIPSGTPTLTQTIAPTGSPTSTITVTSLPTGTPTDTLTPAPTLGTPPPSPPPLPFALQGEVVYVPNDNASGCAWQGVGGQVLNIDGNAFQPPLVVSVTGGGLPEARTANSGTNSLRGPGGFEILLTNSINTQVYFVQLQTSSGTNVAEVVQVTFPGTCEGNLALLTFQATR